MLKVLIITQDEKLKDTLGFCFRGWDYDVFFENSPHPDVEAVTKIAPNIVIIDIYSADKKRLEVCDMLKKDFATAYIPVIALINKKQLRQDLLGLKEGVDDYLISPPDPFDLKIRIEMAVKKSQHSFYASPLTGLPGGILIESVMKEKVSENRPFVAGHIDIDNFKAFNDKYGYLKGDRVIMQAAYMLSGAVRRWGNNEDFVGHIGGDDFVLITTPDKYNIVCQNFICMFDTIMPFHYQEKDRRLGYIEAKDRTNRLRKLPIMSVTMALVLKTETEKISNVIELNEKITEIKQYLKKIPGSKYMADRRARHKMRNLTVQMFKNDEALLNNYKPLGQILVDRDVLTFEQLDKALKVHWKRRALLGEILKELDFLSDEELSDALLYQAKDLGDS
ncbi:MAG: diguanylate cyclase [Candidatus Omnitrophota bacterium]|nr:diguanylate cyclase [Candidatus Omnitrophota bacterium]